jgi:hypothetical protein
VEEVSHHPFGILGKLKASQYLGIWGELKAGQGRVSGL